MNRTAFILSSLSLLAVGCARPALQPQISTATRAPAFDVVLPQGEEMQQAEASLAFDGPGSYVVYRLSGSYRDGPATITQRVVAQSESRSVIDVTIDESGNQQRLRLRLSPGGEIVSVARLEGEVQRPYGVIAYEQLMAGLMLAADENQGMLGSTGVTVDVNGAELAATRTSYNVRVGAHQAVMSTVAVENFPWGHIGGEIATLDGTVLYKAEVIDIGNEMLDASVAAHHDDDLYEGYDDE